MSELTDKNSRLPEKLNLWDRFFNRYYKEIYKEGKETWVRNHRTYYGTVVQTPNSDYTRNFVIYKVIDRLTGSVTLEKVYLE